MNQTQDSKKVGATVLTELSKAFAFASHAFGFDFKSLRVIYACLNGRIQVKKVVSSYNKILQIFYGVLQGSISGQVLFNVTDFFLV